MAKKTRAWYIDRLGSIGIVEKSNNAVSKDGYTSNWISITEVKDVRIYSISKDADIAVDALANTWSQIPAQYHEMLVNKVISNGYKDPRNFNIEAAQYFDMEYEKGIKEAKKFSRSNYQTVGRIAPQDF